MKKTLLANRLLMLLTVAGLFSASCSRQTAYNALSAPQLEAQQMQEQNYTIAKTYMQKTDVVQNQVPVEKQDIKAPANIKKENIKRKVKNTKTIIVASLNKKAVVKEINKNFSLALNTAAMGAKSDTNDALVTVGAIFLVMAILAFIIPPLFLTALSATGAQMLVLVAIAIAVVGLLLMATGGARNAEKK